MENNGTGGFGFASNLSLNVFGGGNEGPFGASYGTTDITLRLDSPGKSTLFSSGSIGTKRKWADLYEIDGPEHPALALGLGHPSSSSDNSKGSSATACTMSSVKETTDEESSVDLGLNFQLHLGNDNTYGSKKQSTNLKASETGPLCDLQLSLSTGPLESVITSVASGCTQLVNSLEASAAIGPVQSIEEGSATSSWKLGSYLPRSIYNSGANGSIAFNQVNPFPTISDSPSTVNETLKSPVACTSGITHPQQRTTSAKICQFQGCIKGARGASGLCIAHGGGRRCQKAGCHKGAEGRTVYCKAHGGGRRCNFLGCTKSAEGRTDYCIAHGGGRRCSHEGCIRAARGKSGLCIRHGGGKRCQMKNCTKSAEGYSGLCITHGGGRRCQFPECTKGAQGSTMFCKAHGGGKRCTVPGCTKGAEGSTSFCKAHGGGKRCSFQGGGGMCPKSVHGGTQFCVAHGGGKRCAVPECTKSARGRTDYCVRHGGGKRCKSEGCGKSAQGSTDYCKAHGGGKRCSWGHGGSSNAGSEGPPCDRFARGKTGLCAAHSALVQDRCVHGGGILQPGTQNPLLIKPEKLKEVIKVQDSCMAYNVTEPRKLMHPVVLFPSKPVAAALPEGRVHGGSLMAILSKSATSGGQSSAHGEVGTSNQGMPYTTSHNWL
ncbi:uncharacterized protein M6B38_370330 [Iris pallida]|uniref:WRKY19-like zinc finger domain-containing protein n=1 Tax=Iris pallida TaxID=29817 RepID=A0AAX6GDZ8_IRIPA|nr:uncharacterized protein M6B38_370330 [Iris pallida]